MSPAVGLRRARGRRADRRLRALVAGYAVVWIATAIAPSYRSDWLLENLLVFALVGLLAASYRRFRFSNFSYLLIALFLTLHAYGAHYTYSETPLGDWVRDRFGLARNHYDRLVHFAFGLLLTYPVRELTQRLLRVRRVWAYVLPFLVTLSLSAGYESIESWVARIVSPELGAAYLGTQGDEWDAQKDMDHAMSGALICIAFVWLRERLRGPAPRPQRS